MPAGAVAWWPAEGSADDVIGSADGTLQGGATFAPGMIGQAFSFDGVDDFIQVAPATSLEFRAGSFTVELWIRLDTLGQDQLFFQSFGGPTTTDPSYFFELSAGGALRFAVLESVANRNDFSVAPGLLAGQWHHVAAVRSGNTSTIYRDGALVDEQTAGTNVDTGLTTLARIGRVAHDLVAGQTRFVDGLVDELALYDRALSSAEIQAIFTAAGRPRCTP